MRKLFLLILLISGASSSAFAKNSMLQHSLDYYQTIIERAVEMGDIAIQNSEPAKTADMLVKDVHDVLQDADQIWIDQARIVGDDLYLPYLACSKASYELNMLALKYTRHLRRIGNERIDGESDWDEFKQEITSCEISLGLEPTFDPSN